MHLLFFKTGLFSRGNSHVARLCLPIYHLLDIFTDPPLVESGSQSNISLHDNERNISVDAVNAAKTIVYTCLKHVGKNILKYYQPLYTKLILLHN